MKSKFWVYFKIVGLPLFGVLEMLLENSSLSTVFH
uniref:Uncharacterized protein n=1 Tax=Rhizophora mucronata TaxID=61149 RepID=A0A2P2QNP2_RHIMU